jgi:O-antigen/teichoic acid export membrane protein
MASFRRGFVINFASSSAATVVQFVVSMILARMLTPSEIGVFSITVVFVNVAHVFRDFGVASYVTREKELTPEKVRSAIGVLYTSTWLIALGIYLASGWIADYFGYPEIRPVTEVLALGFVLIPFSSLMLAIMMREFEADKIAWVTLAGTTAYTVTCLTLAYLGHGTMSLAWANFANIAATALAYLPFRPRGLPWLPSFRGWGRIIRFGSGTLLTNLSHTLNNAIPDLLLGKLGSAHQVGLFSRANSTVNIFTYVAGSAVNFGSLSYISKAHHENRPLAPLLGRAAALLTGVGWPALIGTAVFGEEIVWLLYGSTWLDSVPAIAPLAWAAGLAMVFHYSRAALTAVGLPYWAALPLIVSVLARAVLALFLFDGSLASFGWIMFAGSLLTVPAHMFLHRRYLRCTPADLARAVWPSVQVAVICVAAAWACKLLIASHVGPSLTLLLAIPVVGAIWLGALAVTAHPLLAEIRTLTGAALLRFKSG